MTTKIAENVTSGTVFSARDQVSVDFWDPARSQKDAKSCQSEEKPYLRLTLVPSKIPSSAIVGAWTPQVGKNMRTGASKMGPRAVRNAKNKPINDCP